MNKVHMIAGFAAILAGSMVSVQMANAQSSGPALCSENNPNCCPPLLMPVCGGFQSKNDFLNNGCPVCENLFQEKIYDLIYVNEWRNVGIAQQVTELDARISAIEPQPQPSITMDYAIIGLVIISIALSVTSLVRKR